MKIHMSLMQSNTCPKLKSLPLYIWNDLQALSPTFAALYCSGSKLQVLCFIFCPVTATVDPPSCANEKKAILSKLCLQ